MNAVAFDGVATSPESVDERVGWACGDGIIQVQRAAATINKNLFGVFVQIGQGHMMESQ